MKRISVDDRRKESVERHRSYSCNFLDRYNRYTKRQATFPKEQESRNEFLSVLNYNPLSYIIHVVTSKEHDAVLLSKEQS